MPRITTVAPVVPPYAVQQSTVRAMAQRHFAGAMPSIDRYVSVFNNAQIDTRYFVQPPEWFLEPRSFQECNDTFIEWSVRLGAEASEAALMTAGLTASDVDHVIFVSTTGLATPSPDARLMNVLPFRRHTRRTPIWGLGCAGGVAGLARAYEYVTAFPHQRVLLVCVELCSMTFQWDDWSTKNLIAASLFGDGAAAVLVEGDAVASRDTHGPTILGTQSTLWPDTLRVMGWDIVDTGMQVVFSHRIPTIVTELMRDNVEALLQDHGLRMDDVRHFILHPGGAKVIAAYERSLGLRSDQLVHTRATLQRYGNMSSSSIFFVLDTFMRSGQIGPGDCALLAVLGPGFSSELALIRG